MRAARQRLGTGPFQAEAASVDGRKRLSLAVSEYFATDREPAGLAAEGRNDQSISQPRALDETDALAARGVVTGAAHDGLTASRVTSSRKSRSQMIRMT
jgi:hypothetical protein